MFGFSFLYKKTVQSNCSFSPHSSKEKIIDTRCQVYNQMNDKFGNDKIFYNNDKYIIVIDGVILNNTSFIKEGETWTQSIIRLYSDSDLFFKEFKGCFSGILYDKEYDKLIFFSDQIGTKFMYYTETEDCIFFTSSISNAYEFLKQNNIPYSLSIENAYLLLTYGYMLEDRTLCSDIYKLRPGHCFIYFQGLKRDITYYLLDNTPDNSISKKDAIDLMDEKFRQAIKLEFDKDCEYGYKHLVGLSAGLDSRMVTWVAHEIGYTQQLNFTFSQSNYWDQTVPQKIASDLRHEWIFKALDNGLWLKDVDEVVKLTGGNVLYYGQAHGMSMTRYLDFSSLGMVHSGQQGDIAFDTYYSSKDTNKQFVLGNGAYSKKYLHRINSIKLSDYANEEIANYYFRSFSGANHGFITNYPKTEVKSPFADIDVLSTILKIPLKYRMNRDLYFEWILSKYPAAGNYVWDHIGMPINRKWGYIKHNGHRIAFEDIPKRLIEKFGKSYYNQKNGMNPLGYYLSTNKDLQVYVESYLNDNIDRITDPSLKADVLSIMHGNSVIEKIQALTLLSALKLFFN